MKLDIKVEGLDMVIKNLQGLDKSVVNDVQGAIDSGAKTVAGKAKQLAPKGPTGNLKRAIKDMPMPIDQPRYPLVALAVVDRKIAPHAHLVEYGARGGQMPAKPYLRPAFDMSKGGIQTKINRALSEAVRRHN